MMKRAYWRKLLLFEKWLFYAPIFLKTVFCFHGAAKQAHKLLALDARAHTLTSRQHFFYFSLVLFCSRALTYAHFNQITCIVWVVIHKCIMHLARGYLYRLPGFQHGISLALTHMHWLRLGHRDAECENVPLMWALGHTQRLWHTNWIKIYNFRLSSLIVYAHASSSSRCALQLPERIRRKINVATVVYDLLFSFFPFS